MALRGTQRQSEALKFNRSRPVAFKGVQWSLVEITHLPRAAPQPLRREQSRAIQSNQEQSRVIKRQLEVLTCPGQLHSRSAEDHNDQSAWREHLLCQGAA